MQVENPIYDNHGRPISYIRIAVTDRCNLRCFYCMPAEGIHYLPKKELLSYEELHKVVTILAKRGVRKVRLTGGEPFLRKDLMSFIDSLNRIEGIDEIAITTNGVLTAPHIQDFKKVGIKSVNLSLDSLDKERFYKITRRDEFEKVMGTLEALLELGIETKINAVVMENQNTEDIIPLVALAKEKNINVRFIEEMPFNGEGSHYPVLNWHHKRIEQEIKSHYSSLKKIPSSPHSTSINYSIDGFQGNVGIIPAFSRTFCGSCNRIRLTAQGMLKTCLYDDGVLDIKALLRNGATDQEVQDNMLQAFANRAKDGFEAESNRKSGVVVESMSTIGG
jgi:molybdenum cofactor biosynthesis protein A